MPNIKITIDNLVAKVEKKLNQEQHKELSDALSYVKKGAYQTEAYQSGRWDGRTRMFKDGKFPAGLYSEAAAALRKMGFKVLAVDKRVRSETGTVKFDWVFPGTLRGYQERAVESFKKAGRGAIVLPTASGKTLVAARIIYELGVKSLFLVQTREALKSTMKDFEKALGRTGETEIADLTVTTVQSFTNKRSKKFKDIDKDHYQLIILDEVHHYGADTFFALGGKLNAYFRLGVTATYKRGDGAIMRLMAVTGKVLYRETPAQLIKEGYLAEPIIHWINYTPEVLSPYADGRDAYSLGIIRSASRNIAVIRELKKRYVKGDSVLIIVNNIEHGEILESMCDTEDIDCAYIHGKAKDRAKLQDDFESGVLKVAIATKIYDESINLPYLNCVIMAAGGKSDIRTLQRIGRVLRRPDETKATAEYIDFVDEGHRVLDDQYLSRRNALEKVYGKEESDEQSKSRAEKIFA